MSKKKKKKPSTLRKERNFWTVCPVTKVVPDKKKQASKDACRK